MRYPTLIPSPSIQWEGRTTQNSTCFTWTLSYPWLSDYGTRTLPGFLWTRFSSKFRALEFLREVIWDAHPFLPWLASQDCLLEQSLFQSNSLNDSNGRPLASTLASEDILSTIVCNGSVDAANDRRCLHFFGVTCVMSTSECTWSFTSFVSRERLESANLFGCLPPSLEGHGIKDICYSIDPITIVLAYCQDIQMHTMHAVKRLGSE